MKIRLFLATLAAVCVLVCLPAARASAATTGPSTWHVLVGGQSADSAIQAEGYYPHVITIDVGDTVVWTLNTTEVHSVTFAGSCGDSSCTPACFLTILGDISPCGAPTYDGVAGGDSSGRMVPAGFNWDNGFVPGPTTFSLTFTSPGTNVYFDLSVSGMRGVVVVNPAGTPYPFTQSQYAEQAREQLQSDLAAGFAARDSFQGIPSSINPDGTQTHYVSPGTSPPEAARVALGSVGGSSVRGNATLVEPGAGSATDVSITVKLRLSGLTPGSVHSAQILPGLCGAPASTTGFIFDQLFSPATFTLNTLTAGPDGSATSTTVLAEPANSNGPGQLRIPSSGWFINVATGSTPDNAATSVACGNVVYRGASVLRYIPQTIHVRVGDTVVWANDTTNEVHGVTFLAGQPLPLIPDWFFAGPSGNPVSYDGSSFLDSGPLYGADSIASGRNHSFAVTFTKTGTFPYVDVEDAALSMMQGTVVVVPRGSPNADG